MNKKEESIFLEYFNDEKLKSKDCIRNYKDRKVVFFREIDGEKFYIKKYVPYGKAEKRIAFGLQKDRAEHYKFISDKFKKLGVKHVEPYYIKVNRYSFFKRTSILVTKDGGISLENYVDKFEEHLDWFKYFFDLFIYLCKNGIYCTDFNPDGILVNSKGELVLIDFDAYKTKLFLTKKYKRYLIKALEEIYSNTKREKKFEEYCKKEIKRVIEELKWKI